MILSINRGSSSIKFAVYPVSLERPALRGKLERIGLPDGSFKAWDGDGAVLMDGRPPLKDHEAALKTLLDWLHGRNLNLRVAGHRVVHGGPRYDSPRPVTPELVAALKALIPLAPEHLPQEIEAIEAITRLNPGLPQVACFDTAFHRSMPRVAQLYGLPRELAYEGILRYGFHGLSYEYIAGQAPRGRVVAAHLGNGASLAAIRDGVSVDTSMGFTPTGGITMGTRSGDVDPTVVLYLIREKKVPAALVGSMVNEHAGLLGLSGLTPDMGDLLAREKTNPAAAEAVAVFCYQARKYVGAYAAVMDGLDTLVFAGGIGENAAAVRERICAGLGHLGVRLDPAANASHADVISSPDSPVRVRIIRTNEEWVIARQAKGVIGL
ncbi:MAG TPA: acetate/propionate family kinase [Bryobacteraceae bacterium]|nr:acetate/propionate family kinase [Bryobacteraceae bacterium]